MSLLKDEQKEAETCFCNIFPRLALRKNGETEN